MKVLIYMNINNLKPTGGPAGYLYNLKNELDYLKNENIFFINKDIKKNKYRKYYDKLPKYFKEVYKSKIRLRKIKFLLSNSPKVTNIDFNQYDIIHFHSTFDLYSVKDTLKDFNGKIVLTSHSPKPYHLEFIEDAINIKDRIKYKEIYEKLDRIDEYAFENTDYIVFTCEDAEEPYFKNWEKYKNIKNKNKNKYKYLLTGCKEGNVCLSRKEICLKYNIPEDAFIISYVGRHNFTKGYEDLKNLGEKILRDNKNIYFLVAGKEEPIKGLKHSNWIEVGWTNDPHSIIAASDIFILPNKETYFDLVMLEVLSLEKVVLASKTGGNKQFQKYHTKGIILYDNIEDAYLKFNDIILNNKENLSSWGKENRSLFDNKFNSKIFAKKYIELMNNIYNQR